MALGSTQFWGSVQRLGFLKLADEDEWSLNCFKIFNIAHPYTNQKAGRITNLK